MRIETLLGWLTIALIGCTEPAPRTAPPATVGSSTVASLRMHPGELVTVNVDEGSVTWVDTHSQATLQVPVGGEPTRITAAGDRVWVSLRLDGEVVALDATGSGLQVARRQHVGSEPYGIAASPDGSRVYVAVSSDDQVLELDGSTLSVRRRFDVPDRPQWLAVHPDGGSLVVGTAQGHQIWWVDLRRPSRNPVPIALDLPIDMKDDRNTDTRVSGDPAFSTTGQQLAIPVAIMRDPVPPLQAYYAPVRGQNGTVEGTVVVWDVVDGAPSSIGARLLRADHVVTQAAWEPEGQRLFGVIEGMDLIAQWVVGGTAQGQHFSGRGPRGLAWSSDSEEPWVHAAFDLTVAPLFDLHAAIPLATSALDPQIRRGRQLFYSALDPRMSLGGISCASCHLEGRSDGRTWALVSGEWQTPSLAGDVDATAPVTWSQEVGSVAEEADLTLRIPMGGTGVPDDDLAALAAFVNDVRLPLPPSDAGSPDLIAKGEEAFLRGDVGCITCHRGPQLTDNQRHDLFGSVVQTPTLRGIGATAPYLHDGSVPTLEVLLERSEGGHMGHPERLSSAERRALIAWMQAQ